MVNESNKKKQGLDDERIKEYIKKIASERSRFFTILTTTTESIEQLSSQSNFSYNNKNSTSPDDLGNGVNLPSMASFFWFLFCIAILFFDAVTPFGLPLTEYYFLSSTLLLTIFSLIYWAIIWAVNYIDFKADVNRIKLEYSLIQKDEEEERHTTLDGDKTCEKKNCREEILHKHGAWMKFIGIYLAIFLVFLLYAINAESGTCQKFLVIFPGLAIPAFFMIPDMVSGNQKDVTKNHELVGKHFLAFLCISLITVLLIMIFYVTIPENFKLGYNYSIGHVNALCCIVLLLIVLNGFVLPYAIPVYHEKMLCRQILKQTDIVVRKNKESTLKLDKELMSFFRESQTTTI